MATMKEWVLRHRPDGDVGPDDLEYVENAIPQLADGDVLLRTIYLSLDPTNRIWMSDRDQYMPPVRIGDRMRGGNICVVEQSRSDNLAPGDIVSYFGGWGTHSVTPAAMCKKLTAIPGVPLTAFQSVFGGTGITAWFGLKDVGQPKPGETVVVTSAAGAVGSIVCQLAKLEGCRVIGIAGGAEKCRWLVEELGIDGAIDYRSEDVGAALDRLCPDGIDVDFENVGGEIMDAIIARMNNHGRLALCGMIATYNDDGPVPGPRDFAPVLMHRLRIEGFIITDYMHRAQEAVEGLARLVVEGKLKWQDHVDQGLENALQSLDKLFTGGNRGKLLVQVSPEP
ncbi:MAG: NADP-dependent oxidoreductase [Novosphingobium sp.]|nr:NADP-dependent oxidoreductase [Novosphingobium sp.]